MDVLSRADSGDYAKAGLGIRPMIVDACFVAVVVLGLWWLIVVVAALIKMAGDGPVLYRQVRVGQGGRRFTIYKFRTLPVDAPILPTHEISHIGRSSIGAFLRWSRLDELPQVLNILRGEMSLIGPRPSLPCQLDVIAARKARGVLALRPGLTGPSQVRGVDMRTPEHLAATDAEYIRTRSWLCDGKILFLTLARALALPKLAHPRNPYQRAFYKSRSRDFGS